MEREFKRIDTIIFDIDGTLIDTFASSTHSLKMALKDVLNKDYTDEQLLFHFGIPSHEALLRLNLNESEIQLVQKKIDYYFYKDEERNTIFRGIEELLETLHQKNICLGIVTSQQREEYNLNFGNLPIAHYFDTVICADDTERHKPYPEPVEKFLSVSGNEKDGAIYIGDTMYDYESAHRAKIKFGLACWGSKSKNIDADYFLKVPNDVLKII